MRRSVAFCFAILASACGREARTNPPASSETTTPAVSPTSDPINTPPPGTPASTSTDSAADERCAAIRKRFDTELQKRTDACNGPKDCSCYGAEGGGCGGVTDTPTAKRLEPISAEFHAEKCRYEVLCAAWACAPKCNAGRCSR